MFGFKRRRARKERCNEFRKLMQDAYRLKGWRPVKDSMTLEFQIPVDSEYSPLKVHMARGVWDRQLAVSYDTANGPINLGSEHVVFGCYGDSDSFFLEDDPIVRDLFIKVYRVLRKMIDDHDIAEAWEAEQRNKTRKRILKNLYCEPLTKDNVFAANNE